MIRKLQYMFLLLAMPTIVIAQGTNNNQPLDSADIINMFRQLGMQVFKFPFLVHENKTYHLAFSFDIATGGMIEKHLDDYEQVKKGITKNSPYTIDDVYPPLEAGEKLIRVYTDHSNIHNVSFTYGIGAGLSTTSFSIDTAKYDMSYSRAFNYATLKPGEKIPLAVYYMNNKGTPMLSCPGRAKPEDIIKRYGYAIIIYAELKKG